MSSAGQVVFLLRTDAFTRPGGDTIQAENYVTRLRARGWDVEVLEFRPWLRFPPGRIVHVFNVDRVYDFLATCMAVDGCALFVSPIHHARWRVGMMRARSAPRDSRLRLLNLLPENIREYVAFCYRTFCSQSHPRTSMQVWRAVRVVVRVGHTILDPWSDLGRRLDEAQRVFLLAPGEGEDLVRDAGWSGHNDDLTPNSTPPVSARPPGWSDREGIVAVGRIEPRKRSLELLWAAEEMQVPIRFIGAVSPVAAVYGAHFSSAVAGSHGCSYLGELTHDQVQQEILRSRVLVNVSFAEVQSLVELEAAACGAYVVACSSGNSADFLPPSVLTTTCGFDIAETLRTAADLASSEEPPSITGPLGYTFTWETTVDTIEAAYVSARG